MCPKVTAIAFGHVQRHCKSLTCPTICPGSGFLITVTRHPFFQTFLHFIFLATSPGDLPVFILPLGPSPALFNGRKRVASRDLAIETPALVLLPPNRMILSCWSAG